MTTTDILTTRDLVDYGIGYDGSYSAVRSADVYTRAAALARGDYQRAILLGSEAVSGGTLRGRARSYAGRYRASARNFLSRCERAGIEIGEAVGPHGKRVVVFG